jgi:sarcosine oxidase/L-pipecolate oxidase
VSLSLRFSEEKLLTKSISFAGMVFPPNEKGLLKLCSCRYVTNYSNSPVPGVSVGRSYMDFPGDRIPIQIESELRTFLRDTIPELADRPWERTRMCWLVT